MRIDQAVQTRKQEISSLPFVEWDHVIIGGGITGVQLFRILSGKGKKVLLIESGDYASSTSANSGMLIWGGLLYLKYLDVKSVFRLSRSRDRMIQNDPKNISVLSVTYVTNKGLLLKKIGLWVYWLFSSGKRKFPHKLPNIPEKSFIKKDYKHNNVFEEAIIRTSDSRYLIDILIESLTTNPGGKAHNYLELVSGSFLASKWKLLLHDKILEESVEITAKSIINCAGVKTSEVNSRIKIHESPVRHVWSKGVYLNLKRHHQHNNMLIFDDPENNDVLTFCPFGEISLWGPTEDNIDNKRTKAFILEKQDIKTLKSKFESCLGKPLGRDDIISYRVGVRPLCVPRNHKGKGYTLEISRKSEIYCDNSKNFIAVYGGKFTDSYNIARKVALKLGLTNIPDESAINTHRKNGSMGKSQFVTPDMAIELEQCWTLKDYLRNRTFIHQSIANGGFGLHFENQKKIKLLSENFLKQIGSKDVSFDAYFESQKKIDTLFREACNE